LVFGAAENTAVEYIDLVLAASIVPAVAVGHLNADYNNAVSRGPRAWCGSAWSPAAKISSSTQIEHKSGHACLVVKVVPNSSGRRQNTEPSAGWKLLLRGLRPELKMVQQMAHRYSASSGEAFAQLSSRQRPDAAIPFQIADRHLANGAGCWKTLSMGCRPEKGLGWADGRPELFDVDHDFSKARAANRCATAVWQMGRHAAPGISDHTTTPVIPPDQYQPDPALRFSDRRPDSLVLLFNKKTAAGDSTIVVPVRTLYMTINTQSVVLAETGEPIEAHNIQLSIDSDSWTWLWSADVPASYEAMLTAPIGELVELVVTLNGLPINLVVEPRKRSRRFAKSRLAIGGRGKAAWLAEPSSDKVSRTNTTLMTAQQIMAAALSDNGVSIGWDIDWQLVDWSVPAGTWSHSGTAIEACLAVASSAGGYIQAHSTAQILRVLPRYPVAPWEWSTVTPAIDIPEDLCTVEDIDDIDKARYNSVFISGQANGVLCHVTRAGTDGGRPAPMVIDSLITQPEAGRQRGLAILSDTGRQKIITISMPVLPEIGIVLPGTFIRYRENGNARIGLTRGVSVSSNFPKIRQSVTVETHVF